MPANSRILLQSNAWCGAASATGGFAAHALSWATTSGMDHPQLLAGHVKPKPGLENWQDPQIGWGVVLADRDDLCDAHKAKALDAPECLRALIAQRGDAPVFRYRRDFTNTGRLQRYYTDRGPASLDLSGARGTGNDQIPHYLLIVGSPQQIPWHFQYRLQTQAFVGRLDLDEVGLAHYIESLMNGWKGSCRRFDNPLIWSVNHGYPDITHLMAKSIGAELHRRLSTSGFDSSFLTDAKGTLADLYNGLKIQQPAFVATTSHGATFPLDDTALMKLQLGLPVDNSHVLLDKDVLQQWWSPHGAVWYAHACCSAGADQPSTFNGLVDANSMLGQMLTGVAAAGPCIAPLPRALLGRKEPLGAFVGHIEPTFDWTLRDPQTGALLTQTMIIDTFYQALHSEQRTPIGMAMDGYYNAVAGLLLDHVNAVDAYNRKPTSPGTMLKAKLVAMDRLAMVILGDPTVSLPR